MWIIRMVSPCLWSLSTLRRGLSTCHLHIFRLIINSLAVYPQFFFDCAKLISLYLFPMKICGKMLGIFFKTLWISTSLGVSACRCGYPQSYLQGYTWVFSHLSTGLSTDFCYCCQMVYWDVSCAYEGITEQNAPRPHWHRTLFPGSAGVALKGGALRVTGRLRGWPPPYLL